VAVKAIIVGVALLTAACASGAAWAPPTGQADCERRGGAWRAAFGTCEKDGGAGGGAGGSGAM
jgi:hypothetical protein